MKLHLPIRLFRAVIVLMAVAMSSTAFSSPKYVISANSSLTLMDMSDLSISCYEASSLNDSYTQGYQGGAIYASVSTTTNICKNAYVLLSHNSATSSLQYTYGGAIYINSGRITLNNNINLYFLGNYSSCKKSSAYSYGGAICSSGGSVVLDENENIVFSSNLVLTSNTNNCNSYGGAIYNSSATTTISENSSVVFRRNYADSITTLTSNSTAKAYGGAIYGSTILENNDYILFSENSVRSSAVNSAIALGGAVYSSNIRIRNNKNVVFERNYERVGSSTYTYRLRGLYTTGTVNLSAGVDNSIQFRDSMYAGGDMILNEQYNGLAQVGDIIFCGEYTEKHLSELKSNYTAPELHSSLTSIVEGDTTLYDGRLIIRERAILEGNGLLVNASASGACNTTVLIQNAHLNQGNGNITFASGTVLEAGGISVMSGNRWTMSDGSSLTLHASAENSALAVLSYNGHLFLGENITLNISVESIDEVEGPLILLNTGSVNDKESWNTENITIKGLDGLLVTFDDLYWDDNTLYFKYRGHEGNGSGDGIATLYSGTWANAAGDGVWNTSSENWTQDEVNYAYKDGVQVIFGDTGAGNVTLVGELAPSEVFVESSKNYTWNSDSAEGGKLTGSMELTKKGSGTLTINTANDYTGGTAILGGTVVAGTPAALGSGAVRISDASLIIQADGFSNALSTAGNCNIEVQENGSLILTERILNTGNLTINGSINASALQLIGTDDTYVDVRGHEGSSGFMKASGFYVQVVSGGTVSGNAEVTHGTNTLTLGSDGYATCGGGITYDAYYLNDGDSVSVVDAERASSDVLTTVNMKGGTLYADSSTAVSATGGNILLSAGTLSGTAKDTDVTATGGTLSAVLSGSGYLSAKGNVTISASNTHTGGTMFNGGTFTLTHANALGNGTVITSGTNTLLGNANQSLKSTILNSGALTLSGSWNLSALDLSTQAATHVDINGHTGESGFFKSTLYEVCMVQGGTTTATDLSLTHNKLADGLQLVLGSNGTATAGGVVNYNTYYLAGRDSVSVSEADTAAGGLLNNVVMNGGNLTVDASTHVTATGGSITVTDDATLSGTITDTDMTFAPGDYTADITADINGNGSLTINGGNVSLSGDNSYTGGTIINGGSLIAKDADALGTGTVTVNGGTLNLNNQQMGNDITLNNGTLVGNDKYNGNLSIGGDNVAVEGGYTLGAGKVLEVEVGGTEFNSDLTLGGGTLLFKGAPLTVNGEVSFVDGTTTLVDLRSWEGQLTDGLTLAVLGSDVAGWTDACLELIGMGDMSLVFDDSTGSLTLQIAGEAPVVETITWLGAKGAVWQTGRAGWMNATTGYDAVFDKGADVIFTQPGTVTIAGAVEPGAMIVAGDKAITFKADKLNPGRIVGEASLIKRGNGTLTLNEGNNYTGGTFIEAGTVVAGGAASFGSGAITISGGTLDLKGKAVLNDITLTGGGTIKNGKTFGGELILDGELLKGSTLNIAEKAEIKGGSINGTLSGIGTVTVSGEAALGTTGKLTTNGLEINGTLTVSAKGMSMNTKASAITVNEGCSLISSGAINAYSMEINGGTVAIEPIKASSVTLTDSLHLNNVAMMNLNGKLSAKGSVTIEGGSKLILSGALSAKNLTLGSGDIYMTSSKLQTIKVSNELTLNGGTALNFGFSVTQADIDKNKAFKILTFKVLDTAIEATDLYSLLGLSEDICTLDFDKSRKSITLVVNDMEEWNKQAEATRNAESIATATAAEEAVEDILFAPVAAEMEPELQKAADTLVQSTWGTVGASRAFGDTIANRGTHATLLEGGKGAAWISTMGGSSRISSEAGHAGADFTLTGAAFGIEAHITADSVLGLAVGNSWGKVSTFSAYPVDQDSTHAGIYGNHKLGNTLSLSWMAAHTRTENDVNLAGMPCTWSQDALQLDARLTWAKSLTARTTVNAFGGLQYLATDSGECNGIKTGSLQNLRAEIGVGATHRFTGDTMAYGELSFIGDVVRNNPTADFGGLRSHGTNPGRAGMNLSVGATHRLNDDWSVNATYNLELMQNITSHGLNIGATYSF